MTLLDLDTDMSLVQLFNSNTINALKTWDPLIFLFICFVEEEDNPAFSVILKRMRVN